MGIVKLHGRDTIGYIWGLCLLSGWFPYCSSGDVHGSNCLEWAGMYGSRVVCMRAMPILHEVKSSLALVCCGCRFGHFFGLIDGILRLRILSDDDSL